MGGLVIEGKHACIPEDASTSRLGNTVKAYLESHPEGRGRTGIALVAAAFAQAFPCGFYTQSR